MALFLALKGLLRHSFRLPGLPLHPPRLMPIRSRPHSSVSPVAGAARVLPHGWGVPVCLSRRSKVRAAVYTRSTCGLSLSVFPPRLNHGSSGVWCAFRRVHRRVHIVWAWAGMRWSATALGWQQFGRHGGILANGSSWGRPDTSERLLSLLPLLLNP